jgi:hypothetical protein
MENDLAAKLIAINLLSERVKVSSNKPKQTKPKEKKEKHKSDKKKENKKPKSENKKKKEKREDKKSNDNTTSDELTVRKWNDFRNKDDLKKGSFTKEENDKVLEAICGYVYENNLTQSDLINLVTEKQTKDKSVWPKIAECLPNRSVQSVHNYCHRVLNPFNYKGTWSHEEEKKLIE